MTRIANPYQGAGQIAAGPRFIVRQAELSDIRSAWAGDRPGNVSIRGNFRMGKSSLVRSAAKTYALDTPRHVVVVVSAGAVTDGKGLLRLMAKRAHRALQGTGFDATVAQASLGPLQAAMELEEWFDVCEAVTDFFLVLADARIGVLMIVDELDRMAGWSGLAEFQFLRDLASEPEFSLGLTTISRRSVYDIETSGFGGSTLGGVLGHSVHIGLFSEAEGQEMIARGASAGISLTPAEEDLNYLAGTHPFLLESACFWFFEESQMGVGAGRAEVQDRLTEQITSLYRVYLRDLEIDLPGAVSDISRTLTAGHDMARLPVATKLPALGLARACNGQLIPFSRHFGEYLRSSK